MASSVREQEGGDRNYFGSRSRRRRGLWEEMGESRREGRNEWRSWSQAFSLPVSQVHAYIISSLKKEMPSVFGKDNKKKELVNNLAEIYGRIEREHQISPGDFPNLKRMQVTRVWGSRTGDSVARAG